MMKVIKDQIRTFEEWEELLLPIEIQALDDYCYGHHDQTFTANEVFNAIVEWNGGIATAYHIKSIMSRVYQIEFQRT